MICKCLTDQVLRASKCHAMYLFGGVDLNQPNLIIGRARYKIGVSLLIEFHRVVIVIL